MTKTFPTLVRLLVVLAMLVSLVAITAMPASAGTVVVNTVTVSPATAGSVAGFSGNITLPLQANAVVGDTITITFPDEVTMPSTVGYQSVSINGIAFASSDAAPYVDGQKLILTLNATQAANVVGGGADGFVISPAAGIKNPGIAKTAASAAYLLTVVTSRDQTAGTKAFGIIPSYTISASSGDRNTQVTVSGKGWTPNSAITISNGLVGVGTADADGVFSLTTTAATGSGGAVNCADGAGQTQAGGAVSWDATVTIPTYTLDARVMTSPASGNVGSTFYVLGYDFTSGGNVPSASITLANTAVDANGGAAYTFTTRDAFGIEDDIYVVATVPDTMTGGVKTLSVTGNGTKVATATFTVNTPTMTLEPASGAPNTMVTVRGSNFKAADQIAIGGLTFAGAAWNTVAITIDSSGNWIYSVQAPATAVSGNNPIAVTTLVSTAASATFAASARTLTLNPATGPKGTKVTVGAANMDDTNGTVGVGSLTIGGAAWNTAVITIDSQGNLSPTTLEVPSGATVGANTVAAVDSGSLTASGTFTVTQPTVTVSPTTGYKGDTVTITGAGWVPGSLGLVTITFNTVTQLVTTPGTEGTFTAQMAIPVNAVSGQLIGASDTKGNTASSVAFLIDDPSLSIDPASGPPGTIVTVTGQGFQPQSAVTALTIGAGTVLPATTVVTDTLGAFTSTFSVPGLASGAQAVSATVYSISASSFFTIAAAEATVATALASISNELVRVWSYTADGWKMYDPSDPIGSDLGSLSDGKGYWVKVTATTTVVYLGKSRTLDIVGWNLMGW